MERRKKNVEKLREKIVIGLEVETNLLRWINRWFFSLIFFFLSTMEKNGAIFTLIRTTTIKKHQVSEHKPIKTNIKSWKICAHFLLCMPTDIRIRASWNFQWVCSAHDLWFSSGLFIDQCVYSRRKKSATHLLWIALKTYRFIFEHSNATIEHAFGVQMHANVERTSWCV